MPHSDASSSTAVCEERPAVAFLSSLVQGYEDLRGRIYELGKRLERPVWVDEKSRPRDLARADPLETVDELLERIREAEFFICVLGGSRHGSIIRVNDRASNVSYFEIELFQAALLQRPIHLLIRRGFSPGPRLAAVLELLRFALPRDSSPVPMDDEEIVERVEALLTDRSLTKILLLPRSVLRWFTEKLYLARGWSRSASGARKEFLFLDHQFEGRGQLPDKELVEQVLLEIGRQRNEEKRLSRLWICFRELMSAPYDEARSAEFRPLWNRSFCEWSSAGAWYGLHAHLYLGCLAALRSMAKLRGLMRDSHRGRATPPDLDHPGGAIGSALYSISKRVATRQTKRAILEEALQELTRSIESSQHDLSGLYAIRGSVYRQLWKFHRAVEDYERVLRMRQRSGSEDAVIGEALSELGYGYLFEGKLLKGCAYLKEGVQLLGTAKRIGFLVRAKRKLAVAHLVTGHPALAYNELQEARQLARQHGVFDQL